MLTIEMLPANEGDALWIEYGEGDTPQYRLLIDCGRTNAYRAVKDRLRAAIDAGVPLELELFVLTHVDEDHIYGSVRLIADRRLDPARVGDVWFNGYRHFAGHAPEDTLGAEQGEFFGALLRDRGFPWNAAFEGGAVKVPDDGPLPTHTLPSGMKLTLLSPTSERMTAMKAEWEAQLDDDEDPLTPGDWEAALERFAASARAGLRSCPEIPGVRVLLEALVSRRIPIHVVSGGDQDEVREALAYHDLARFFHGIHGSPTSKREHLEDLREAGELLPGGVFFGDALLDMELAEGFNLAFVFVAGRTDWPEGRTEAVARGHMVIEDFC